MSLYLSEEVGQIMFTLSSIKYENYCRGHWNDNHASSVQLGFHIKSDNPFYFKLGWCTNVVIKKNIGFEYVLDQVRSCGGATGL